MWELEHREDTAPKNWCFLSMVLEKTLECLLDSKEIKPVNPKGIQLWIFIGRTDVEAEAPILGHLLRREDSLGKTLMLGNIECKKEKEAAKDEVTGWHHWLKGHEFEQTLGDSEGQESLVCCIHGVTKNWTQLRDWATKQQKYATKKWTIFYKCIIKDWTRKKYKTWLDQLPVAKLKQ